MQRNVRPPPVVALTAGGNISVVSTRCTRSQTATEEVLVADTVVEIRRRAAERARAVLEGTLTGREFCEEFADVDDRAVAELIDLLEHEPPHGSVFDGGADAWRNYQADVRDIINALES